MALTPVEEAQTRELLAQEAALLSLASSEATIISKLGATKVNLSQLPAASSVADADLLLIRQGSTDKSISGSIIKAYAKPADATETVSGTIELSTNAEVQAGTDAVRAVTPAGRRSDTATTASDPTYADNSTKSASTQWVRSAMSAIATAAGFSVSLSSNGYVKFPSWLGGIIIQWGYVTAPASGDAVWTFPLAFPTGVFKAVTSTANNAAFTSVTSTPSNLASIPVYLRNVSGVGISGTIAVIAIGY